MLLAVGILGATVMPHVIYLHSALTQDRIVPESTTDAAVLLRYTRIDVLIAMTIARLINCSMLVMAASTFYVSGLTDVDSLESAHKTLEPLLGATASALFAVALLGSGLSSLGGRDARRPGRDAGLHPAPDPALGPARGDDAAGVHRRRRRGRPVTDARHLARSCSRSGSRSR